MHVSRSIQSMALIKPNARFQSLKTSATGDVRNSLTILVLGGTGFVGRAFISAARRKGHRIISLSRRGELQGEKEDAMITWISGDATAPHAIEQVVESHPDINACFHCIGLLLDQESGLASLNKLASGSGSIPSPSASYDLITRTTGIDAIKAMRAQGVKLGRSLPFVFVSAAEAGWTFKAPVDFLERYLVAKRAVEEELLKGEGSTDEKLSPSLRGAVLRPSLIWTWERPQALLSVLPFYALSALGLPFVDKPVLVETLVEAALASMTMAC